MLAGSPPLLPSSPLLAVLGPTGSGKSDLALALALKFHGEIIGCDSIQVYRGLDIGSAKLPVAARRGIAHHVIDILDVPEELTAGAYSQLARQAVSEAQTRHHLPIVTGGTGFYFRALLDGLSPAPRRNEALRRRLGKLAERRPAALHRFLRRFDPPAAARIHPNDHQKLIRAVELTLPATHPRAQPRDALTGFDVLKIGLAPNRTLLYDRLSQRCTQMFEQGLLDETQALLASGYPPAAKALQSLGYKQAVQHLSGNISYTEAISDCQTRTRQYAKRQITWFRREPNVQWLPGFGSDPAIQQQATELARNFLAC